MNQVDRWDLYNQVIEMSKKELGYSKLSKYTGVPKTTVHDWVLGKRTPRKLLSVEEKRARHAEYQRKLYTTNKERIRPRKYAVARQWRISNLETVRAHNRINQRVYRRKHYEEEKEKGRIRARIYWSDPKKVAEKHAREKQKGFVPLIENIWNCPIDWHHVSPNYPYVVPLPRIFHQSRGGKYHFVHNAGLICNIFGLELEGGS